MRSMRTKRQRLHINLISDGEKLIQRRGDMDYSIRVWVEVDDGAGKPFSGGAGNTDGVSLGNALFCCKMALLTAGYQIDDLFGVVNGEQVPSNTHE